MNKQRHLLGKDLKTVSSSVLSANLNCGHISGREYSDIFRNIVLDSYIHNSLANQDYEKLFYLIPEDNKDVVIHVFKNSVIKNLGRYRQVFFTTGMLHSGGSVMLDTKKFFRYVINLPSWCSMATIFLKNSKYEEPGKGASLEPGVKENTYVNTIDFKQLSSGKNWNVSSIIGDLYD